MPEHNKQLPKSEKNRQEKRPASSLPSAVPQIPGKLPGKRIHRPNPNTLNCEEEKSPRTDSSV